MFFSSTLSLRRQSDYKVSDRDAFGVLALWLRVLRDLPDFLTVAFPVSPRLSNSDHALQ